MQLFVADVPKAGEESGNEAVVQRIDFILCAVCTSRLQDKIWEWPGDEAILHPLYTLRNKSI